MEAEAERRDSVTTERGEREKKTKRKRYESIIAENSSSRTREKPQSSTGVKLHQSTKDIVGNWTHGGNLTAVGNQMHNGAVCSNSNFSH